MGVEKVKAYWAWITICIIWGTTYLAIRVGVKDLPPVLFAGFRWIIAGLFLLVYLRLRGKNFPRGREVIYLGIVGLSLLGIANGLVVFAEQWVPSGLTALLITTIPFWFVGLEAKLPHGPKLSIRIVFGLVLGMIGVVIIFGSDLKNLFDPEYAIGIVSLLGAVVVWSAGSLYSKYKKVSVHPVMGAAVQMLIAGIALILFGIILGELPRFSFNQNSFLAFTYLVVFGSVIAYPAYIYALTHLPISFVSTYAYINPIIALALGWLILDEKLDINIAVAAVIILVGVAIVTNANRIKNGVKLR